MKPFPHKTVDNYCCACPYDIAGFEERINESRTETIEELEEWIYINSHKVVEGKFVWQKDLLSFLSSLKNKKT